MLIPPLTALIMAYLLLLNVLATAAFALDKIRARRKARRIPEKVLLGLALAGGALGGWAGVFLLHHKNRSPQFLLGLLLILAGQVSLLLYWLN